MSKKNKSTLKGYFTTGSLPTQANFEDLIDSLLDHVIGMGMKEVAEGGSNYLEVDSAVTPINVSGITGLTYASIEAAATALIAASKKYTAIPEGTRITYLDPQNLYWSYLKRGNKWLPIGDTIEVPLTLLLNNEYLAYSTGVGTLSAVVAESDEVKHQFGCSEFIEIHPSQGVLYEGYCTNAVAAVACYDADFGFISTLLRGAGSSMAKLTQVVTEDQIPANAKYIRVTVGKWQASGDAYDHSVRLITTSATKLNALMNHELNSRVRALEAFKSKSVAGFWTNNLDPECNELIGDKSILDDWDFYLIDVVNKKNLGKLKKNNILRFANGQYAPVVVAAADDVEAEYETEDQGYMIVRAWNGKKHLVNGTAADSREVFAISDQPIVVGGINSIELDHAGIAAGLATTYQGKMRVIPFKNIATAGANGQMGITKFNNDSYIRGGVCAYGGSTSNECCRMARALNANADNAFDKSVFAEQMAINKLSHIYAHFLKYGTYYLHDPKRWGGATSSNEGAPNSSTWGTKTGVRWSIDGRTSYSYGAMNTSPTNFKKDASGTAPNNWSTTLNGEAPKWKCLESLLALSYAVDNNIEPDTDFTLYGETYFYKTIPGTVTPLEGELNAKVFKKITISFTGYDASGNPLTVDADIILVSALVDGYDSWGDVFDYGHGGLEVVSMWTDATGSTRSADVYLAISQDDLTDDNRIITDREQYFDFEKTYRYLGRSGVTNHSDGYGLKLLPYSIVPAARGGGLSTGVCAYSWMGNNYGGNATNKVRLGVRGRGYAAFGSASSRYWLGNFSASSADATCSFAPQVRMDRLT